MTNPAVLGYEPVSGLRLIDRARERAPDADVAEWALLYADLCPVAGVRTAIAFAQALKETNSFRFTGTARPEWNNPAGLGVTGADGVGNRFATRELGVRAHLGHLLWYFGPPALHPVTGFCAVDLRHFGAHKDLQNDVRELGGRWAPAADYGATVLAGAERILGAA
jgi:N-acetylmuramoyl-L-alanine amidase